MTSGRTSEREQQELLTSEEAADYLRTPLSTLYRWATNGTGPAKVRLGRRSHYRRVDLDAFIESRRER